MKYPSQAVETLIEEFSKLPGIGKKTAQRLALFILKSDKIKASKLASAITHAKETVVYCTSCQNLTDQYQNPCYICISSRRNRNLICIVESPSDVFAIERTGHFNGLYHVLHGHISPLDGIGPDDLKIKELFIRLQTSELLPDTLELIVALSPTVEGETTTLYLTKIIKPLGIKMSRIARGIPIGAELEYADEATITRALEGRIML
ncbi:hypothetical protein CHS0354_024014 [Potamilus streckersoni]|uniref:Toprim domain-containing protein n=1 Tax=Potamilus streckersoni TaxID=2493646 RepID=A0AAE0VMN4_9BIVA|nr:hypothetical protein CHS0354_024014 [Potamilus streckersoni]